MDCPFTPAMLKKVAYAGSQSASFAAASEDLAALAETPVSRERVQRWTKRVGEERLADVACQAEAYRALPWPAQRTSPTGAPRGVRHDGRRTDAGSPARQGARE